MGSLLPRLASALTAIATSLAMAQTDGPPVLPYPVVFVTQVPVPADFTTIGSVFGNHLPAVQSAARGGDLWIRYGDGRLKNLTEAAGFGESGRQGAGAIAVRDPAVHFDGQRVLFSMVVGAPTRQYESRDDVWQLFEITGLGPDETPTIRRIPNQPASYNNVSPAYASDDSILFTSDRPRGGEPHLYPQLDEYEEAPTTSGLWRLHPGSGELVLLDHSPSGNFTPILDSFGRVIFTRWDHLQRDQQADADAWCGSGTPYGTFNYADESAGASYDLDDRSEVFPEPRPCRADLLAGTGLAGHRFNHFFPWQIAQDGTGAETLNHIGRQELHGYLPASRTDDPEIVEFYGQYPRTNGVPAENLLQVKESPLAAGHYLATQAPEFQTHAAGQLIAFDAAPDANPDDLQIAALTHPETAAPTATPGTDHSGLYREPLPLSDGRILAVHTPETRPDANEGTRARPRSRYDFTLRLLEPAGNGYLRAGARLTQGIEKSVSYFDPDVLVSYAGALWELNPVELRPRLRPTPAAPAMPAPEREMFRQAGVDPADFQRFLRDHDLALVVSRDVTVRDDLDRQQPFNLRVPGGVTGIATPGRLYDVSHMRFYQADQVRGLTGCCSDQPRPGRRVLARVLNDPAAIAANPPNPRGPTGSVPLAADGSQAAFVPARRAMTWELTDPAGEGVVRERYWLTFQPGEIRVCAACHGVNRQAQTGTGVPQNPPQALLELLRDWADRHGDGDVIENEDSRVEYDGWRGGDAGDASGGRYREAPGFLSWATLDTPADGDGMELLVCKGPDLGKVFVFVDARLRTVLDLYAPSPGCGHAEPLQASDDGPHQVLLFGLGSRNPASTGSALRIDGLRAGGLTREEIAPGTRLARWESVAVAGTRDATAHRSDRPRATLRFQVDTPAFEVLGLRCPACGRFSISVDGQPRGEVETYATQAQPGVVARIDGLGAGTHQVELRVLPRHHPDATGTQVYFDGVRPVSATP